jgi:hypothetical protein
MRNDWVGGKELPACAKPKRFSFREGGERRRTIQKDYRITALFYWAFSEEGNRLSRAVAREVGVRVAGKK